MKILVALALLGLAASAGGAGHAQATATAPVSPAVLTEATPAMWKIKSVHGTVYLFGSIHVMKKDVRWETAKVKDALGASDTLYLEIAGLDDASLQAAQPQILQMGTDTEHPLSTKISKDDVALLDSAVKGMGLPGEQALESLQPWLVYLTISVLPAIADALGSEIELMFDGGIRSGQDILRAVALGARSCMSGRAYIYGLGAAGQAGVAWAIEIMRNELDISMALTGVTNITEIDRRVIARM